MSVAHIVSRLSEKVVNPRRESGHVKGNDSNNLRSSVRRNTASALLHRGLQLKSPFSTTNRFSRQPAVTMTSRGDSPTARTDGPLVSTGYRRSLQFLGVHLEYSDCE